MKALKISKYQWCDTIVAVGIYYGIFLAIIIVLASISINSGGKISSSGLELSSVIFLFIVGLNSFKESFKFSQANNVSRKTYFKGIIIGVFPVALLMSAADLIINRVYNIFVKCPTNFDMIYGPYRETGMRDLASGALVWVQSNDISTLLGTLIWQFTLYSSAIILGILISLIYYRCNNLLKVIVSLSPLLLSIILNTLFNMFPQSFTGSLKEVIPAAFGWHTKNPYAAVLTFLSLSGAMTGLINILLKRAVPKE